MIKFPQNWSFTPNDRISEMMLLFGFSEKTNEHIDLSHDRCLHYHFYPDNSLFRLHVFLLLLPRTKKNLINSILASPSEAFKSKWKIRDPQGPQGPKGEEEPKDWHTIWGTYKILDLK